MAVTPRQNLAQPTAQGIGGDMTVSGDSLPAETLALDDDATGAIQTSGGGGRVLSTMAPPPALASTTPAPAPSANATGATSEKFSTGMVVGVCVGAFAGAVLIILIGVVIYRKSAPKAGSQRRPSRHRRIESKPGGDADSWEGKFPQQTSQLPNSAASVAPMEKLTMFQDKSTTSLHSHEPPSSNSHAHLAHIDTGPALSWGDTDGGRMSPMFTMARQTPQANDSPLHQPQSAEVINPFDDSHSIYVDQRDVARTRSNATVKSRGAKKASSHGHGDDLASMYADYSDDEEEYYSAGGENPFTDPSASNNTLTQSHPPPPPMPNHPYAAPTLQTSALSSQSPSTPSPVPPTPVNDPTAINGLLAALDIPADAKLQQGAAGERTTALSTQSGVSGYSDGETFESGVAGKFPKPPSQI